MASCVKQIYQPPAVVTVPHQEIEILLRLSEEEAGILKQVITRIGGDPEGPRGALDKIGVALCRAEVVSTRHKVEIYFSGIDGVPYLRIQKGDS